MQRADLRARLQAIVKGEAPAEAIGLPTPTEDERKAAKVLLDFSTLHLGDDMTGESPVAGARLTPAWTALTPLP